MSQSPEVLLRPLDPDSDTDVDAAFRITAADEIASVGSTDQTPEIVRATLGHPQALAKGHRLAYAGAEAVGLLVVELDAHGREVFLDAYAVGDGRSSVLRLLLSDGITTARQVAADDPGALARAGEVADPYVLSSDLWQVNLGCFAKDVEYGQVAADLGFRRIRRFWRMRRDLTGVTATEPAAPPGVSRRVVDGDADRRTMHALFQESFAQHFGSSHDHPFEEWIASVEAMPGVDPGRWWIASADGVDVGVCLLDDSRRELQCSYVRTLGVVPSARGRGIATWLLACADADAVRRGYPSIALTVDGENTTGATALYEKAGYAVDEVIDVWCLPLMS